MGCIMIVVSKCLTGECCRWDGGTKMNESIKRLVESGEAVAVCPEQLGGLSTPRLPTELTASGEAVLAGRGRAVMSDGTDVTSCFIKGAYAALKAARECGATRAILKANSPSCGCGAIYDGGFCGRLVKGSGVAAALFELYGIEVRSI